jgi:hypothetical protein
MKESTPYTPEILAYICPQCFAAITGKCLDRKPTGGMQYREFPHAARVILADMAARAKVAVDEVLRDGNVDDNAINSGTAENKN